MKRFALVVCLLAGVGILMCTLVPAMAADKPKADAKTPGLKVQVVGLSVHRKDPDSKYGSAYGGMSAGTKVYIRAATVAKNLIEVDADASKLNSFTDDAGTDLKKADRYNRWLGSFPRFSEDTRSVVIEIQTTGTPKRGAKAITVDAEVVLLAGEDEQTETKDLELKAGEKIAIGPVKAELKSVSTRAWGKSKMSITLESQQSFAAIKKIAFLGADGKELGHSDMGKGSYSSMGGPRTYTHSYGLHEKVDTVKVKVTYYAKVEKVTVPVSITFGAGL